MHFVVLFLPQIFLIYEAIFSYEILNHCLGATFQFNEILEMILNTLVDGKFYPIFALYSGLVLPVDMKILKKE